jgi:hypothetical protein
MTKKSELLLKRVKILNINTNILIESYAKILLILQNNSIMIKRGLILLLLIKFNCVFGQKSLNQLIADIPYEENYYSPFSYYDSADKKQGICIQNEPKILKTLKLPPLEFKEYYIVGKYEINNMLVLFFSKYGENENIHFALLLDKYLNIIDRLDETAYDNSEGFYGVRTSISYNIMTTTINNIYNNPEYVTKKYAITNKGFTPIKDQVIIKTASGVRIRKEQSTNSAVVASAPNLSVFNYLSKGNSESSIKDNGKHLNDFWLKIALKDSLQQLGYVFGAFAKRHIEVVTNNHKVIIDGISKQDFDKESRNEFKIPSIEKITDIEKIQMILKKQLVFKKSEDYDYGTTIILTADNGKIIKKDMECGVAAYYPKYHYLLLECGHSSDDLVNLKTADNDINRIGNPDYYEPSPNNTFRLNGYYSGQSNVYFLEKNNANGFTEYLLELSDLISLDFVEKNFWTNDNTMFLKIEEEYYRMIIEKL